MAERATPTRRRPRAAPKNEDFALLAGLTKVIPLDRGELLPFAEGLDLGDRSALSPLAGAATNGASRPYAELRAPLQNVADAAMRLYLQPVVAPDRILDARFAPYEGAPTQTRLFSTRRHTNNWAGLRAALARDYELLAPYTDLDLAIWIEAMLEKSAGRPLPMPWNSFDGEELAFFLALVDAFKLAMHQSFTVRRPSPQVPRFRWSDIVQAQNLALQMRDRRWLLTAIAEIFATMAHPGGSFGVTLPLVSKALSEREVRRYVDEGWLKVVQPGRDPLLELAGPLPLMATSLLSWFGFASFHDTQVTSWVNGRSVASEEALLYFITEGTIWVLVTEGLTNAEGDLGSVRFGIQTLNLIESLELARRFLLPIPIEALPDGVYAPAATPPVAPAAPAAPEPAAPVWSPTHVVPAGGISAWERPDPSLPPAALLDPGLDVRVLSQNESGWANILCSNGWSAWVDASRLEEVSS